METSSSNTSPYRVLLLPLLVVATGASFSFMLFGWNGMVQGIGGLFAVASGYLLWIFLAAALVEPRLTRRGIRMIYETVVSALPGIIAVVIMWRINKSGVSIIDTQAGAFWLFMFAWSAAGTAGALSKTSLMGVFAPESKS